MERKHGELKSGTASAKQFFSPARRRRAWSEYKFRFSRRFVAGLEHRMIPINPQCNRESSRRTSRISQPSGIYIVPSPGDVKSAGIFGPPFGIQARSILSEENWPRGRASLFLFAGTYSAGGFWQHTSRRRDADTTRDAFRRIAAILDWK